MSWIDEQGSLEQSSLEPDSGFSSRMPRSSASRTFSCARGSASVPRCRTAPGSVGPAPFSTPPLT
jgi:hypothetical protein